MDTDDENRARFAALLEEREALRTLPGPDHPLCVAAHAAEAELRRLHERARATDLRLRSAGVRTGVRPEEPPRELLRALRERFRPLWEAEAARRADRDPEVRGELLRLAALLPVRTGPERRVRGVYPSAYSSQGFGASAYARGEAEELALHLVHWGVSARVARAEPDADDPRGLRPHPFLVLALLASDLDAEIARLKPPRPLREQVAGILRRGLNPRVYLPHLPHGFEAEHRIGPGGRDLP